MLLQILKDTRSRVTALLAVTLLVTVFVLTPTHAQALTPAEEAALTAQLDLLHPRIADINQLLTAELQQSGSLENYQNLELLIQFNQLAETYFALRNQVNPNWQAPQSNQSQPNPSQPVSISTTRYIGNDLTDVVVQRANGVTERFTIRTTNNQSLESQVANRLNVPVSSVQAQRTDTTTNSFAPSEVRFDFPYGVSAISYQSNNVIEEVELFFDHLTDSGDFLVMYDGSRVELFTVYERFVADAITQGANQLGISESELRDKLEIDEVNGDVPTDNIVQLHFNRKLSAEVTYADERVENYTEDQHLKPFMDADPLFEQQVELFKDDLIAGRYFVASTKIAAVTGYTPAEVHQVTTYIVHSSFNNLWNFGGP